MGTKKIQKIIASITLFSFVFSTILLPVNEVRAAGPYVPEGTDLSEYTNSNTSGGAGGNNTQNTDLNSTWYQDNGGNRTDPYSLNVTSISEVLPAIIGCTGIVNKVQNSLTSFLSPSTETPIFTPRYIRDADGNITDTDNAYTDPKTGITTITPMEGAGLPSSDSVPTADKSAQKTLDAIDVKEAAIKKEAEQARLRQECIDGIAYSLAKAQLAKMTQVTVNWINSGYSGDPLYIRDRESYFQSIADGQLLDLVGPLASIKNRYIYPFGQSVAKSLIGARKAPFETRAQSTLQGSLKDGATTEDFANDFSKGGWDGWFSLTQNDQNNPLGFGIMTSQELADRTAEKTESAAAELAEGKGFLSQKRCAEYEKKSTYQASDVGDVSGYAGNRTATQDNTPKCLRWETVTPGTIIAEQAATSLTSGIRQLELADSLNESLSAVFQALINQMVNQGLESLSSFSTKNTPQNSFGGPGSNKIYDSNGVDITGLGNSTGPNGTMLSVNKGRGWYNVNGTFDITKDLGDIRKVANGKSYVYKKGVISIQKDYIESIKLSMVTLPKIVPALGELDYCIPGPNPGWEGRVKTEINNVIEYLRGLYWNPVTGTVEGPEETEDSKLKQIAKLGLKVYIFTNPVAGMALNFGKGLVNTGKGIYGNVVHIFGGKTQAEKDAEAAAKSEEEAKQALIKAEKDFYEGRTKSIQKLKDDFFEYKKNVDELYGEGSLMRNADPNNPFYLPMAEAGLQATKYITTYDTNAKQAMRDYKDLINQSNANIYKLNVIKKEVDAIVLAARKRRALDPKGVPMIDPSCYDLNGTAVPNTNGVGGKVPQAGGTAQGPGSTTKKEPTPATGAVPEGNGATAVGPDVVPTFTLAVKEAKEFCEATITGTNKTTGTVTDTTWGVKIGGNPTVYSKKTFNLSNTFSTLSQSGSATVTLTVRGGDGIAKSVSKIVTIPKRTVTSLGTTCPQ